MDTVVATADAACNTIGIVNKTALYGSKFMDAILERQSITLAVDTEIFKQTIVEQKAMELASIRTSIETWASQNNRSKELYELSLGQIRTAVEAKLKPAS
jgi:hypothetical protein